MPSSSERRDWWIHGVTPLAAGHVALYFTLQSRPGTIAIHLWKWGPPALMVATAVLLGAAFWSGLRQHHGWSGRRVAGLAGLCALVFAVGAYRIFPSSHDHRPSPIDFRLPLEGPVRVAWGGPTARVNYHVRAPAERWAYDLLVTIDGITSRGTGATVSDYYAYGKPVRAPASGRVIDVHDGDPDAPPGRADPSRGAGNRIVIEVSAREYLVIAHLKRGTIRVSTGDAVRAGDLLAMVGNSGNSSEPHVHLHLQDSPTPGQGEGIPLLFANYALQGGVPVRRGIPEGGVRNGRYVGDVVQTMADANFADRRVADPEYR
jgi:hypothetical protein